MADNNYWTDKDKQIRLAQAYNLAHAEMILQQRTIIDTPYICDIKNRALMHYQILTELQEKLSGRIAEVKEDNHIGMQDIDGNTGRPKLKLKLNKTTEMN